jgi:hypothetical protein
MGLRRKHCGTVYWVVDGVAFRELQDSLFPQEVALWVYCDDLKGDVSQLRLVESPELIVRRQQLRDICMKRLPALVEEIRENPRAAQNYKQFARITMGRGGQ